MPRPPAPESDRARLRTKFSVNEDLMLQVLVGRIGEGNWHEIARHMGTRTARQCRDRYKNYLGNPTAPDPWTPEEDALILQAVRRIGPKWADIAKILSGRNAMHIKNRWHRHLAKAPVGQADRCEAGRPAPPKEEARPEAQAKPEQGRALDWDQILPQRTAKSARAENMFSDWYW
jgi:hypothetical protein